MNNLLRGLISALLTLLLTILPFHNYSYADISQSDVDSFHSSYSYPGDSECSEFKVSDNNEQNSTAAAASTSSSSSSLLTPEFINQINVMLIGMIAPIIPMQCKDFYVSPPLLVYMATGIAYLVVEFNAAKEQKKMMKQLAELTTASGSLAEGTSLADMGKVQIDGAAKKTIAQKQSVESVEKRKKQYQIVATMMTVAAVAALAIFAMENIPYTANAAKAVTPQSCSDSGNNKNTKKIISGAISFAWTFAAQYAKSGGEDFKAGSALLGSVISGAAAGMTSGKIVVSGATAKMGGVLNKTLNKAGENAPAEKSFGTNLLMGIVFGAQAGLAWWGDSMLKKKVTEQEDQYKADYCNYYEIKKTADATSGICVPSESNPCAEIPKIEDPNLDVDPTKPGIQEKPKSKYVFNTPVKPKPQPVCASHDSEIGVNINSNCSKPVKFETNFKPMPGGAFPNLADDMKDVGNYGNAIASGKSDEAALLGDKLLKNAARINSDFEKAKKIVNKIMHDKGNKDFDINKEIQNGMNNHNKIVADALKEATGENVAAPAAALSTPMTEEQLKELQNDKASGASAGSTGGVAAIPQTGASSTEEGALDLGLGEDGALTEGADLSADMKAEEKLSDFNVNESDITNKPDVSLFKLLSNRYLLSYPKVLNEMAPVESEASGKVENKKSLDEELQNIKK